MFSNTAAVSVYRDMGFHTTGKGPEGKIFQIDRFYKEHDEGEIVPGRTNPKEKNTVIEGLKGAQVLEVKKISDNNPTPGNPRRSLGKYEEMVITKEEHFFQEKELKSDGSWSVIEEGRAQHAIRAITRPDTNQYYPVHYDGRVKDIGDNRVEISDERYNVTAQSGFLADASSYSQP